MKYQLAFLLSLAAPAVAAPAADAAHPWFGVWALRLTDPGEKPETLIYSDAGGGAMRMESVEDRSVIVTHFDGRPAPDTGSGAAKRYALAIKAVSPTVYEWTFLVADKPLARGRNELARNRRTFTEVSWSTAQPGKTRTVVYERH